MSTMPEAGHAVSLGKDVTADLSMCLFGDVDFYLALIRYWCNKSAFGTTSGSEYHLAVSVVRAPLNAFSVVLAQLQKIEKHRAGTLQTSCWRGRLGRDGRVRDASYTQTWRYLFIQVGWWLFCRVGSHSNKNCDWVLGGLALNNRALRVLWVVVAPCPIPTLYQRYENSSGDARRALNYSVTARPRWDFRTNCI